MRQARHNPEQDREPDLFREGESLADHVIGFLLVRRLEHGNHRELGIETRVLFVLRGVHRGIVGRQDDKSALDPRHGSVYESVGTDVHADVLHADEGALARIGHAERSLHRSLFICTPAAPDFRSVGLDELGHFSGRRTGIGIDTGKAGVQSTQRYRLVSEQQSFL